MGRKKLSQDQLHKTKIIFKGNPRLYFKTDVMIDFKMPKNHQQYAKTQGKPLFPTFSNDRRYFTPAFCLAKLDVFKDQDCIKIHKQKVQESLRQIDEPQIMEAKPGSKSLFCGICKTLYEDYKTHLQEPQHQKILAESQFQKQIVSLCKKYGGFSQQLMDIQKKISTETKINEDESLTECLNEQKKTIEFVMDLVGTLNN